MAQSCLVASVNSPRTKIMDIEAPEDGRIEKILVKDGQSFIIGAILAIFTKA